MKAFVDKDECISCGLCESICPEVFQTDDDGTAVAIDEELEGEKLDCAQEAAEQCPTDAITVDGFYGLEGVYPPNPQPYTYKMGRNIFILVPRSGLLFIFIFPL